MTLDRPAHLWQVKFHPESTPKSQCNCLSLVSLFRDRVRQILSVLEQEKALLLESVLQEIHGITEQNRTREEINILVIQGLKNDNHKLVIMNTQLRLQIAEIVNSKRLDLRELQGEQRKVSCWLQEPKSPNKELADQKVAPYSNLEFDKMIKIQSSSSVTTVSKKPSLPNLLPFKLKINPQYKTRSQKVKAALQVISWAKNSDHNKLFC